MKKIPDSSENEVEKFEELQSEENNRGNTDK